MDFHCFAQRVHITNDFLKVRGGHGEHTAEFNRGDGNTTNVQFNQVQGKVGHHLFFAVEDFDTQFGRVRFLHGQHNGFVVGHGFNELEKVNHVEAEHLFLWTVELIKTVGTKVEGNQNGVGAVHSNDF